MYVLYGSIDIQYNRKEDFTILKDFERWMTAILLFLSQETYFLLKERDIRKSYNSTKRDA